MINILGISQKHTQVYTLNLSSNLRTYAPHMMEHLVPHIASSEKYILYHVVLPNVVNQKEQKSLPLANFG